MSTSAIAASRPASSSSFAGEHVYRWRGLYGASSRERRTAGIQLGGVKLKRGEVVFGQAEIEVRLGLGRHGLNGLELPPPRTRADRHP